MIFYIRKCLHKILPKRKETRKIDWETEILLGDILKPRLCLPFNGILTPFSVSNGIGQTRSIQFCRVPPGGNILCPNINL